MKLDKELINKCTKYRDWLDLEDKMFIYHNFKQEFKEADNYNDFLHNIAECYIIAISMFEKEISIDYMDYMEIIGNELVENLDNFVNKKQEENKSWDLSNDTIIRRIENIIIQNEKSK